jgi:hypothetical protein
VERIIAWVATQRGRRVNLRTPVNTGLTHRDGARALA